MNSHETFTSDHNIIKRFSPARSASSPASSGSRELLACCYIGDAPDWPSCQCRWPAYSATAI